MDFMPIVGYSNYKISKNGVVFNISRNRMIRNHIYGRYLVCSLCEGGKQNTFYVHRLVAIAFHGFPADALEVDHIDRDRFNNNYLNLRWVDHRTNLLNRTFQRRLPEILRVIVENRG